MAVHKGFRKFRLYARVSETFGNFNMTVDKSFIYVVVIVTTFCLYGNNL
jgi:hypothetical protein